MNNQTIRYKSRDVLLYEKVTALFDVGTNLLQLFKYEHIIDIITKG